MITKMELGHLHFVGGGSEGDGTYQNRGGKYVKVGDLVHVSCFIRFSNKDPEY